MKAPAPEPMVRVEGLVNRFGSQMVHDAVDLEVHRGEIFGLVGESGSGKSVLLRSLIGLQRPVGGRILFQGRDIRDLSPAQWRMVQKEWGVLFQQGALFSGLTVLENIELPMQEHFRLSDGLRRALAKLRLRLVRLPVEHGEKFPADLSGGMNKRAALARALALDPEILFLDEPTSGLDPISASALDELIRDLRDTFGLTVVLTTHDLHTLAEICDRLAVLVDGKAITGTLEEMQRHPHPWLRAFFRGARMQSVLNRR
ncbi:ABC transporter ATP-binding protein [Thiohalorhabdus sp. Cl-TMA]|uniref:ABC transporter ATP-binding protein n=1 Tax=Thiohalorhabdus methylotrophus TaxID=3242694 RepID=A0ABV4TQV9_9GAMM